MARLVVAVVGSGAIEGNVMSALRSETAIRADITVWEAARTSAAQGKSITIVTSAGTRVVTQQNLSEIQGTLNQLNRELQACLAQPTTRQGLHDFALANMGDNEANR